MIFHIDSDKKSPNGRTGSEKRNYIFTKGLCRSFRRNKGRIYRGVDILRDSRFNECGIEIEYVAQGYCE